MKPNRLQYSLLMRTAAAVNPLLAMDAKVNYAPLFKGVTTKNFRQRKPVIMDGIKKAVRGKTIAKDASLEHLAKALDMFEQAPETMDESVSGAQHRAMEAAAHGKSNLGIPKKVGEEFEHADKGKKFGDMLRDWAKDRGMSEDDLKALDKMHMDAARDEMPEAALDGEEEVNIEVEEAEDGDIEQSEEGEEAEDADIEQSEEEEEAEAQDARHARDRKSAKDRAAKDRAAKDKAAKDRAAKDKKGGAMDTKRPITQDEMNRAIALERKRGREAIEARAFVRPFVGEVPMALDSAEGVYRSAARQLGVEDADTIHASALKTLISLAGRRRGQAADQQFDTDTDMAMDSAETDSFDTMFGTGRISTM